MISAIETEIFKNLFVSICEEMGISLMRTAFSPNIKERRDYSTAIFDHRGETLAQGDHMPVHLGAMPISVRTVIECMSLRDGDVALLNDPYRGGTHLPDLTMVTPVFHHSAEPVFYVANRAHHSDIGGISAGSMPLADEIFQEGLIIPPVKLVSKGRMQRDLLALILANVRTPEERLGDLRSQLAANAIGRRSLLRLLDRYGLPVVAEAGRNLQDYTERMMRNCLRGIPPGTYQAEDFLDDDGQGSAPIPIKVEMVIGDGEAGLDFSGSGPQTRGNVNANLAITFAAAVYVFRCLIREDVPYNSGLYRPLRITTRPGTVVDAVFPAAVAGGNVETSQRIVDVLLKALGDVLPDRVPAASQGTMNNVSCGGERGGQPFAYYETLGGGLGAALGRPGMSGAHSHMTNSLNTPVEALENYLPIRLRRYELRPGSGGAGRWRGGEGLVREYEFLTDVRLTVLSDRRRRAPYGMAGGGEGRPGRNTVISGGQPREMPGKFSRPLRAGDRLVIETPGGGGYGDAAEVVPDTGGRTDE